MMVETDLQEQSATEVASQLLIHVNDSSNVREPICASALHWLRALCLRGLPAQKRESLCLEINDQRGCKVFAAKENGPLIRINLLAGTYDIIASRGSIRRWYTMTLEPGARSDLHLRLMTDRP